TFIISPHSFTNHPLTNQNFHPPISQTQINHIFNQKHIPPNFNKPYPQTFLHFPHPHNNSYLTQQPKHPNHLSPNYISSFKQNQLTNIQP
ncbi:D-alanyl-lipoteichoic acid biosynthesis protein DltD, partial [Staphylococcus epidermidis]|uniref:D-alanyl-lipoteichoic acid biosynthesis protein DltD n=1 Tax=Staphylococcus epidermidis TaxID=1282 RepID=UPI0028CB30B7